MQMHFIMRPRLTTTQARVCAVLYAESESEPAYRPALGVALADELRDLALRQPDVSLGAFVWPDGVVAVVPKPLARGLFEGTASVEAALEASYFRMRMVTELEILKQFEPTGEA